MCPGSSDSFYILSYLIKWVTTSWTYSVRQQNWQVHKCISHPTWKTNCEKNCAFLRILLRSFCRKPDHAGVIVYSVAYNFLQAWFSKFPGRGQFEDTGFTVTQMRAKQWTKEEKGWLWSCGGWEPVWLPAGPASRCLGVPSAASSPPTAAPPPLVCLLRSQMADSEYLRSLLESMPRRMAEVIEKGGNMTKY